MNPAPFISALAGVGGAGCVFFAIAVLLRGWSLLRAGDRFGDADRCPVCQYVLTGLRDERCPECGQTATSEDRARWRATDAFSTQQAALRLLGGMMLLAAGTVLLSISAILV